MTTVKVSASYDKVPDMLRYINVVYKDEIFDAALRQCQGNIVVIMHPHEICETIEHRHELLSYSTVTVELNLQKLIREYDCVSLDKYVYLI